MSFPPTPQQTRRHVRWLAWSLRLRHPFARACLLAGVVILLRAAMPLVAPGLRGLLPPGTIARRPVLSFQFRRPAALSMDAPAPPVAPALPPEADLALGPPPARTALPTGRGETAAIPTAAPITLPCHVLRSGEVAGGGGEWSVEITLDENATDQAGLVVLPTGTNVTGRVRLSRNGEPTPWPGLWRLRLPEGGGATRELEFTGTYQANAGGIATGAAGHLSVRSVNRIGDRHGDDGNVAAGAGPNGPPVAALMGDQGKPWDGLPEQ